MNRWQMFARFIGRAVWFRKVPSVVAILAIVLGTGVIGGLVNLYYDMNQKMGKEFRAYGANLLIYPADGKTGMSPETLDEVAEKLPKAKLVGSAPVQYGLVYVNKHPLVLAGTWFDQMRAVSPYWNVDGHWIEERDNATEAMVGTAIAKKYDLKPGEPFVFKAGENGRDVKVTVAGIVTTGGKEDNQLFVSAKLGRLVTGQTGTNIVLVSLMDKGESLEQTAAALQSAVPGIVAKPLKQMAQSEEKLLEKIEKLTYLVAVVIFITTVLAIMTTMISMVMQRRKEVALKKALGASDGKLIAEFLAEGVLFGIVGCTLGIVLAYYLAQLIGQSVFQSDIAFRFVIVPWAYLGALAVVGLGFSVPVKRIMEVEPAIVLKGE